jgi:hypothetical protein
MRQAQPVWRTKSYNFKREAWEGTGNQWLELLVEFDSVRMRSNLILVAIYKKMSNFKIFQNCKKKYQKFHKISKIMGEIPIIHTYLYNKIVLSFFNIIIQILKFWKFWNFMKILNIFRILKFYEISDIFFCNFGKFWNLTFFCILPRVSGYF